MCTASDRILLHLLDFVQYKGAYEGSIETTQEGISLTILINRKHIPRSLKVLLDKNYIVMEKKHVFGKKQQMKTYFLTDEGRIEAVRLKNFFSEKIIPILKNDKIMMMKVSEIHLLHSKSHTYASIISQVVLFSIFDPLKRSNEILKIEKNENISSKLIYEQALQAAWQDGILTLDEMNLLKQLRKTLKISDKAHLQIQDKILLNKNKKPSNNKVEKLYDIILSEAVKDNRITKDEQAILNRVKKHLNIKK